VVGNACLRRKGQFEVVGRTGRRGRYFRGTAIGMAHRFAAARCRRIGGHDPLPGSHRRVFGRQLNRGLRGHRDGRRQRRYECRGGQLSDSFAQAHRTSRYPR
jgi:hypothetical protein